MSAVHETISVSAATGVRASARRPTTTTTTPPQPPSPRHRDRVFAHRRPFPSRRCAMRTFATFPRPKNPSPPRVHLAPGTYLMLITHVFLVVPRDGFRFVTPVVVNRATAIFLLVSGMVGGGKNVGKYFSRVSKCYRVLTVSRTVFGPGTAPVFCTRSPAVRRVPGVVYTVSATCFPPRVNCVSFVWRSLSR